jgi:hypothetical protein
MRKWSLRILIFLPLLTATVVLAFYLRPRQPRLSISCLSVTNQPGNPVYQMATFRVTNKGNATALHYHLGEIEFSESGQKQTFGTRSTVDRLSPGEECVLEVRLPESVHGRWRFTCLFAHTGFRASLNRRVPHRFVPQRLKGVPLDVKATSDWIEN